VTWEYIIRRARNDDGTLYFPEKLTDEFLKNARKTMGPYAYENQYNNNIIPADAQSFKREWFRYYSDLPTKVHYFAFIDPAVSQSDSADFTGCVVVAVNSDNCRYVVFARRYKITATETVKLIFDIFDKFKPKAIGIEEVAYQKALLHFTAEEMRRRNVMIPIVGVKPSRDRTKEMKILEMVPRFEWGHIQLSHGLNDLEDELLSFPRGAHDDLIDALASMNTIIFPPDKDRPRNTAPHPSSPGYEQWVRQQKQKGANYHAGDPEEF
jgi:predicted phage terminase large subunit-like protein